MKKQYLKAFRRDRNGNLCHLFHARNGTRRCLRGRWIKAEEKFIDIGGGYVSGFNLFDSLQAAQKWKRSLKNPVIMLMVEAKVVRPKPTKSGALMARWIRIPTDGELMSSVLRH